MIHHGGCSFAEDPARPAHYARLFWRPELDPTVIVADAVPVGSDDPEAFELASLSVPATHLTTSDTEELLIGIGPQSIRLSIAAGTLLQGPVRLTYHLSGNDRLELRLLALQRFARLLRDHRLPAPLFPVSARARRRADLLRVIDALADAPTHRLVAERLFGKALVDRDWSATSDYLRTRTRRLIRQTRCLLTQNHLELVRRLP